MTKHASSSDASYTLSTSLLTLLIHFSLLLWVVARSSAKVIFFFFFFNDPAPPEIYPLSLHDPLPISFSSCCSILSSHPSCQPDLPSGPRPLVESLPSRRSRSLDRRRQPPRRFSPLRRWFHSPRRSPPSSADRYSPPQWRPSLDRSPAPALRDPVAGPGVSPRSHRKARLRSLLHWSSPQGRQAPLLPRFLARSRQSAMDSRRLECPLPRHCPATSSAFPI